MQEVYKVELKKELVKGLPKLYIRFIRTTNITGKEFQVVSEREVKNKLLNPCGLNDEDLSLAELEFVISTLFQSGFWICNLTNNGEIQPVELIPYWNIFKTKLKNQQFIGCVEPLGVVCVVETKDFTMK